MRHGFIINGFNLHPIAPVGDMAAAMVAANFDNIPQHEAAPPTPSLQNRDFMVAVINHFCPTGKSTEGWSLEQLRLEIAHNDEAAHYFATHYIPTFSKGMSLAELNRRQAELDKHVAEWQKIGPRRTHGHGLEPST